MKAAGRKAVALTAKPGCQHAATSLKTRIDGVESISVVSGTTARDVSFTSF